MFRKCLTISAPILAAELDSASSAWSSFDSCFVFFRRIAPSFDTGFSKCKNKQKFVDLKGQIISDILLTGITLEQIRYSKLCSYESNECHSYRRVNKLSNRMYAFFWKQV